MADIQKGFKEAAQILVDNVISAQAMLANVNRNAFRKSFVPERVIRNGPATIVFWLDGTKTIVKRRKGTKDSTYHAFCSALAIKLLGSNSQLQKVLDQVTVNQDKSSKGAPDGK